MGNYVSRYQWYAMKDKSANLRALVARMKLAGIPVGRAGIQDSAVALGIETRNYLVGVERALTEEEKQRWGLRDGEEPYYCATPGWRCRFEPIRLEGEA